MAVSELIVKLIGDVSGFQKSMNQVGKEVTRLGKSMTNAGAMISKIALPFAAMGVLAIKFGKDFESAFAGVRKTVNASESEFQALRKGVLDLSQEIPVSAVELSKIMESAGQLGIHKENLLGFTKTMAELGVATNLTSDQAATALARFANITKMPQEKMENLGSSIVALGNNFATTESEIVDMALRLAGAGANAKMSEGDILGMAAALSSVGIQAEAGGTAFSKVIKDIQTSVELGGSKLQAFAETAGLSANDFAEKFRTAPSEAINLFISGLGKIRDSGGSVISALGEMGFSGIRTSDTLLRLSGNTDLFSRAIATGNTAFQENIALQKEAEQRFKTFDSQLLLAKNSAIALGIELFDKLRPALVSLVDGFRDLVIWFKGLSDNTKNAIIAFGLFVVTMGPALLIVGKIVTEIGLFIKALSVAKSAAMIFASATGIGLIVVALGLAVSALVYFQDDVIKIFGKVSEVVSSFYVKFTEVLTQAKNSVWPTIGPIVEYFVKLVSEIGKILAEVATTFTDLFTKILDIASNFVVMLIEATSHLLNGMADILVDFVKLFASAFDLVFDTAVNWTVEILKIFVSLFESLVTTVQGGMQVILDYFGVTGGDILAFWDKCLGEVKKIFLDVFDAIVVGLGYVQDVVGTFSESAATSIGNLKKSMEELRKPTEKATIEIKKTEVAVVDLSKASDENKKVITELKDAKGKETKATVENKDATVKSTEAKDKHTKQTKEEIKASKDKKKADEEAADALQKHTDKIKDIVTKSQAYLDIQDELTKGAITQKEAGDKIVKLYQDTAKAVSDLETAQKNYDSAVKTIMSGGNVPAEQMAEYEKKLGDAKLALEKLQGKAKEGIEDPLKDLGKNLEADLANSLGNALTTALKGGSVRNQLGAIGGSLGSTAGAAFGGAFAGPFGAAIGQALGGSLGEKVGEGLKDFGKSGSGTYKAIITYLETIPIFTVFAAGFDRILGDKLGGQKSEGTLTRRGLDKFFNEQFDANHIMIVIDGQIQKLKDMDFGGSTFGSPDGPAGKYFSGLDQTVQDSFSGIGVAFGQLAGVSDKYSQAIAMVLAQNLGGSLNNLQVMVQGLGLSFEDMQKTVTTAMLDGKLSFLDAAKALQGIAQISQKGIPDAIGATVQAFDNLKNAGIKGGRYATDAIRDIADEAKELNIKTFPALMANLVNSGKLTKDEVGMLMAALQKNGIASIDALSKATDQQLIPVLADLQSQKFPFAEAANDAKGLIDSIDKMPDKKDLTFNIRTNIDQNTKDVMKAGLVPSMNGGSSTVSTRSAVTQNAKGNAFSAGAIIPFAKGGVVSDFTMFDIGSMAERGPEAIMPLERLPSGELGVRATSASNNSGGGGDTINISIDYATPGIEETIRREIDKAKDRRNGLPGIRR